MAVNLSMLAGAGAQFFDNSGVVLSGGKLYSYQAGTTTPQATYTTSAGNVAHANPIILDSAGRVPSGGEIWLTDAANYKFLLATSADVTVATYDNVAGNASGILSSLAASGGSALVGFLQAGTGAVARTAQSKMRESVSVLDFGADSTGVASSATAFNAALAYCLANNKTLIIPDGTYQLPAGTTVNFAGNNLRIIGQGRPTLQYTGSGIAFYCNAGVDGTRVNHMQIENLLIVGGPSVTHGCYLSGVVQSVIRDIEVRECSAYAFNIRWGVSNTYENLKYSASSHTTTANTGVYVTNAGAGLYTADCTFINCVSEDFPGTGLNLHDASDCVFIGGTFEFCNIGAVISQDSRLNTLQNVWFELNTSYDIEVAGNTNSLTNCNFSSAGSTGTVVVSTGDGNSFVGGYIRTAQLQSTSANTSFFGCAIDQNLSGTLGITGNGTYKCVALSKVDNDGLYVSDYPDEIGEFGSYTATATGMTTSPTGTVQYHRVGKTVTLNIPVISGTSNSADFTLTGAPQIIRPTNAQRTLTIVTDNGSNAVGIAEIFSSGTIVLYKDVSASAFTASGTKAVQKCTFSYLLA